MEGSPALEAVAFESAAPTIVAKLMGLDEHELQPEEESSGLKMQMSEIRPLRLLKDAFLGYKAGDVGCGWHVDDKMFWPCEDHNFGERDAGINVWITLSPVTVAEGGGLAVAPVSHKADFAERARKAISPSTFHTCSLQKLDPDSNDEIEKLKVVHDLQPGDAIFHDRYIFHRGEPFLDPIQGKKSGTKRRISLRYVPADATFFELNDNRVIEEKNITTGDLISNGEEYFPQVWPTRLPEEKSKKALSDKNFLTIGKVMKMALRMTKKKIGY